ncbi:MAG: hypothetical protein ABR616_18255 [Dermatophilaceae bacterium]
MTDTPRTVPCVWPLLGAGDCSALDDLPTSQTSPTPDAGMLLREDVEAMAVAYLWNWTGRRFGVCPVTLRPVRQDVDGSTYGQPGAHPFRPALIGGSWFNVGCGTCGEVCGCSDGYASLRIPGPVDSVTEITVDGTVLPATDYRVDNGRLLVRTDGGRWPRCNDLSKATTEPGTWAVEYERGVPVPTGGQVAAGALACEMAKAVLHDGDCRLPQRLQTVTREGVTVGVLDSFEGLNEGKTGIWLVDSWVGSMTKIRARSTIHSPDVRRPQRTTYEGGS